MPYFNHDVNTLSLSGIYVTGLELPAALGFEFFKMSIQVKSLSTVGPASLEI